MYYDSNIPVAKRLTAKQIEVTEKLLSFIPAIEETVKRFNGKIANKRIETALQAIARGIHFGKNQYSGNWELTATEYDDRAVQGEPDCCGYSSWHYIENETLYLADGYRENAFVDGEGRLNAEKLISLIERKREMYRKDVDRMKEQLSRIDSIIATYKEIQAMKEDFNRNIDSSIRHYFKLDMK